MFSTKTIDLAKQTMYEWRMNDLKRGQNETLNRKILLTDEHNINKDIKMPPKIPFSVQTKPKTKEKNNYSLFLSNTFCYFDDNSFIRHSWHSHTMNDRKRYKSNYYYIAPTQLDQFDRIAKSKSLTSWIEMNFVSFMISYKISIFDSKHGCLNWIFVSFVKSLLFKENKICLTEDDTTTAKLPKNKRSINGMKLIFFWRAAT